jgi:hypothetical protein
MDMLAVTDSAHPCLSRTLGIAFRRFERPLVGSCDHLSKGA